MNRHILGMLCLLLSSVLHANELVRIKDDVRYNIINQVDFLLDASLIKTLSDVRSSRDWQPVTTKSVNLGFISEAAWFRFEVQAEVANDYVLNIPYPILDYLDHYSFVDSKAYLEVKTGDARRFNTRAVDHLNFIFPYSLKAGQILTVYLRVDTAGGVDVPLQFSSKKVFLEGNIDNAMFRGGILGITCLMLFYNGFIFLSLRDRVYGFYVLNIFAHIVNSNVYEGLAFKFLWPNTPWINDYAFPIFNGLVLATSILFMFSLLKGLAKISWYRKYFLCLLVIVSTFPVLAIILPYSVIVPIEVLFTLIVYTSSLILGGYLAIRGDKTARYFTVAVSLFLTGVVSSNLKALGLLPTNIFTQYAYQIGFFVDMVVLSLALAQKIDIAQKERSAAQKENIKNLKRYEDLYSESLSGHFQVSLNGRIESVNNAFLVILGYENQTELFETEMIRDINQFSIDDEASNTIITTVKQRGSIVDFEEEVRKKDGSATWISLSIRSVVSDDGRVEYYEGSMIDINERKENEILKEQGMKDRMLTLEQLVVGISHELNTPLGTSITGLSYLTQLINEMDNKRQRNTLKREEFDSIIRNELQTVMLTQSNLERASELINQFKQISVSQAGHEIGLVSLLDSINTGLIDYSAEISDRGVDVRIDCADDLSVNTYAGAISEIIRQLTSNSLDHAFESTSGNEIRISASIKGQDVELCYQDNGKGLSAKGSAELFNPFYTTMRGYQGKIGLGMYLTFNLLTQLLKGDIEVEGTGLGISIKMIFPRQIS